jgi:hypothetical protein
MINPYFFSRLFVLSVLILLMQACGKNDSNDAAEYVIKEVHAYGELRNIYEYNDAWQLIKSTNYERINSRATYQVSVNYFYNNDGLLERTEFANTGPPAYHPVNIKYTYNNQGRLTAMKALRNNGDLSKDEYDYSGQTITATHSIDTVVYYVKTYTVDDRGNIVKSVMDDHTPGNNDYTEEWQDFDDKKNVDGPRAGDVSSKNNPRRYIFYYARPGNATIEKHTTYSYNGAGYVTSFQEKTNSSTYTTKYVLIPKQ